jgi:hypothetical protein
MKAEPVVARCDSKPPKFVRVADHLKDVNEDLADLTTKTLTFAYWEVKYTFVAVNVLMIYYCFRDLLVKNVWLMLHCRDFIPLQMNQFDQNQLQCLVTMCCCFFLLKRVNLPCHLFIVRENGRYRAVDFRGAIYRHVVEKINVARRRENSSLPRFVVFV